MIITALSTGAPINYGEVSLAALRSASTIPGIEGAIPTSRCTSRLVVGSIVNEDPGSGPMSLWCQFRLPASLATNAGVCGLSPSETHILGGSGADAIGLAIMSGDLQLVMGNSSTHTRYALGVASLVGQVVDVVITRSGSTLSAYVNGTPVTLTAVNVNGSVAPNATITATWAHALAPLSSTITSSNASTTGPVHRFVVYNRALSASEAALLGILGVDVSDQWATNAPRYASDFSSGVNGWSALSGATLAGNVDGIGGQNDNLEMTAGGVSDQLAFRTTLVLGKRYRWKFDAFRPSSNTTTTAILLQPRNDFGPPAATRTFQLAADTWTTIEFDVTAQGLNPTSNNLQYYMANAAGGVANGAAVGDKLYTRAHQVVQVGAFLDLQFGGTCGFQASDRANQLDATLFNGAGFTLPDATQGFARWIAAAPAGERMGGSSGIVIPANCSISRIVVTNLNIGDGRTFSLGSSAGSLTDILSATPLNGNGSINVLDPSSSISTTGQLWVSYTGTGSIKVSAFFNPA